MFLTRRYGLYEQGRITNQERDLHDFCNKVCKGGFISLVYFNTCSKSCKCSPYYLFHPLENLSSQLKSKSNFLQDQEGIHSLRTIILTRRFQRILNSDVLLL